MAVHVLAPSHSSGRSVRHAGCGIVDTACVMIVVCEKWWQDYHRRLSEMNLAHLIATGQVKETLVAAWLPRVATAFRLSSSAWRSSWRLVCVSSPVTLWHSSLGTLASSQSAPWSTLRGASSALARAPQTLRRPQARRVQGRRAGLRRREYFPRRLLTAYQAGARPPPGPHRHGAQRGRCLRPSDLERSGQHTLRSCGQCGAHRRSRRRTAAAQKLLRLHGPEVRPLHLHDSWLGGLPAFFRGFQCTSCIHGLHLANAASAATDTHAAAAPQRQERRPMIKHKPLSYWSAADCARLPSSPSTP